jgi:hypothetical protein
VSCIDSIESGIGQETNRGTGLWLYNGMTTWVGNSRTYKDQVYKLDSISDGDSYKKVQKMHDLVLEYAA